VAVESADKIWNIINTVLENPSVMFKRIIVKGITVFVETDDTVSSIEAILK
jgi:hypothetical protein